MESLATPHHLINKNFLAAIGLWPHQSGVVKYLLLFNTIFFLSSQAYFQIGGMFAAWEDTDVFLESIPPVLVDFICAAKIINFIANSKRMKELLLMIEADWQRLKDSDEIQIMNHYALLGRKFTLSYIGCMYGSMTPFMLMPLVPILLDVFESGNQTHTKLLMFRVDFLVDAEKYYYPVLIHSYFGTVAYITMIIAIDTMLMTYVQHACGSFAILGYRLKHLADGVDLDLDVAPLRDEDMNYRDMSDCVAYHNRVLQYAQLLEDANFMSYFFQLGFNMVSISFTGFQTMMNADVPSKAVRYAGFTATQLTILFLQSYPGQMLYDHSVKVSEYVHSCDWYQTSLRTRKIVCLMSMRSRIPCALTAGKFYVLNLANFGAVIRTSMSYLAVLRSTE